MVTTQPINAPLSLFASAARTATQTGADQPNRLCKGIVVILDVTAIAATPSITLEIQGKDPVSGKYYALLTGAAVTGVSTNRYTVYPGVTVAANVAASDHLPDVWRVVITHGDADSITYSVGSVLLV